jgi:hypothetical protein
VDDLLERQARPALARRRARVRIAEGEAHADAEVGGQAEGGAGDLLVLDALRAVRDAFRPGGDHHVLSDAPDIEAAAAFLNCDRDGERRLEHRRRAAARWRQRFEHGPVVEDDEATGLVVARAARHASGLEDATHRLFWDGPRFELALVPLRDDGLVGVHDYVPFPDATPRLKRPDVSYPRPPSRERDF